jgi:ribosomal protein L37E
MPEPAVGPLFDSRWSFTCPRCGRTSHNPTDAVEGYCGACHDWTGSDWRNPPEWTDDDA